MSTGRVVRIIAIMLLVLSIPSGIIAAEGEKPAHPSTGVWACVDDAGNHSITTSALMNNANGRSWVIDFEQINPLYGALGTGRGEGFSTGPDTFENYNAVYFRYPDGSLGFIVISRGKGRIVSADKHVMKSTVYVFIPGLFTDADGNGVPDDFHEAVQVIDGSVTTCSRLSPALSSFPAPAEYPEE